MNRHALKLAVLTLIAPALVILALIVLAGPAQAADIAQPPPAQESLLRPAAPDAKRDFTCTHLRTNGHYYRWFSDPIDGHAETKYDWSIRLIRQHCTSPTTYFDDLEKMRVRGEIDVGDPTCDGDVIGGWKTYTANVGSIRGFNPGQVEWACTSSHGWQFTWTFPGNDNLYVGTGSDRCVGAHVRWVRPNWPDASGDIPQVCF